MISPSYIKNAKYLLVLFLLFLQATREISSTVFAMGAKHQQTLETTYECVLGETMGPEDR